MLFIVYFTDLGIQHYDEIQNEDFPKPIFQKSIFPELTFYRMNYFPENIQVRENVIPPLFALAIDDVRVVQFVSA